MAKTVEPDRGAATVTYAPRRWHLLWGLLGVLRNSQLPDGRRSGSRVQLLKLTLFFQEKPRLLRHAKAETAPVASKTSVDGSGVGDTAAN